MFIPIGGIFVFGNGGSRAGAIFNLVMGLVNLVFGVVALYFGFSNPSLFLKVVGFVLGGIGLLMVVLSLVSLVRRRDEKDVAIPLEDLI